MTHIIVGRDTTPHRVTVICACGKRLHHPKAAGAEAMHATHVEIETARAALHGDRC